MAPSLPVQKTGNVRGCQLDMFESCELTGTGCAMSTAHGLGHTPTKVWATLTEVTFGACGGTADIAEGTHTACNVIFTVSCGVKYRAYAL